jgi:RNA polymerase sigma-70 factor (ECF subfamily)
VSTPPTSTPTPPSLIERLCQTDDAEAWDWFVRLYTPLLYSWARRTGLHEADAADLVQEVLALLVRKLPEFRHDPDRSFRGWLRTVLRNKHRELLRRRPPPIATAAALDDLADPAGDPFGEDDYRHEIIRRALTLLRPDFEPATWEAFQQTVALDRPTAEVAAELGLSINAVRLARFRVLRRLRQQLEGLLG